MAQSADSHGSPSWHPGPLDLGRNGNGATFGLEGHPAPSLCTADSFIAVVRAGLSAAPAKFPVPPDGGSGDGNSLADPPWPWLPTRLPAPAGRGCPGW
jgi:hypothetical protein